MLGMNQHPAGVRESSVMILAPFQGAVGVFNLTGGLRSASTSGYFRATLRVEEHGFPKSPAIKPQFPAAAFFRPSMSSFFILSMAFMTLCDFCVSLS